MGSRIARWFAVALCLAALVSQVYAADTVRFVDKPATKGGNDYYIGNRAPLLPSPLIKLPVGSVRPEGWLRKQMELMSDGFSGRLPEVSEFCKLEGNAWTDPKGEGKWGWEELPYWLKGYVDLAYVMQDKRMIDESVKWLNGIISSQRPDGYFGPTSNLENMDLWPNMCALYALRSHYEATHDKRVLPLMLAYFRWQTTVPLDKLLPESWQKTRGGDNLDTIYWLYNQTGDKWLLDVARVNHERTSDWTGGVASWHGVNIAECFREPGLYYQQTLDPRYLKASERDYDTVIGIYGQVPGGGFGSDENCRQGFTGARQGTETCTWVELMLSHELLCGVTGDTTWADRCEEVAFNSLPPSMTPDLKGLHYLTAPNQIQLDRQNKAPMIQNGGDMFSYNPYGFRCCQHNAAMGWPYFSDYLWMATQGNGIAAVMYSQSQVTAKVGNGTTVKIAETTGYPFSESIDFAVSTPKPVKFPMCLRIPGWCTAPRVSVNDKPLAATGKAGGWAVVDRTWQNGDKVKLELPMQIRVKVWARNRNAVSVYRGPLAYSLKIGEKWAKYEGTDRWPLYEVFPTTPWNYGLVLDPENPAASFKIETRPVASDGQPFTPDAAPIVLKAAGKRIPGWMQEDNGMVGDLGRSPVKSDEPTEEITLVPMGCARLRIACFPQIGDGQDAAVWDGHTSIATASHVSDSISALNDDTLPNSSSDQDVPRFTWWDHLGTQEWVQYTFNKPIRLSWSDVYWFDDQAASGSCRVPASWKLSYWDGKAWQPVSGSPEYGTAKDKMNRARFEPIETTMIRLDAQLKPNYSGGIMEWTVGE